MSPLLIQSGVGLLSSAAFAIRGFFWMDNAAWAVAFLALLLSCIASYSEIMFNKASSHETD